MNNDRSLKSLITPGGAVPGAGTARNAHANAVIWYFGILTAVYIIFTQYPLLLVIGFVVFVMILRSFWKLYQPSVLLFWFLYQWFQVMGAVWFADLRELPFTRVYRSPNGETAVLLGFIGIFLQVIFMRMILAKQRIYTLEELKDSALKININRVIVLYIIAAVLFPVTYKLALNVEALTQVILVFTKLKQIFTILLVFLLFLRGEKKSLIVMILLVEFLSGFLTYFSTFKDVIIISLICYLSFIRKVKTATVLKLLPLIGFLFVLMVFWSAIKGKYRMYVNEGTRTQQVQVGSTDAFKKLFELVSTFNASSFQAGLYGLTYRIQYTFFLAKVLDRIPNVSSHEDGDLILDAVGFVLVPRFLDPDKGVHDASVKTSKYTGLRIAGLSKGTSMSIGYFGDAYIDFGYYGMMIPIVVIALLVGLYYRFLINLKFNILLVYSIASAFIMSIGFFESDTVIILGGLKNGFIVNLLLIYTIYPWVNRYITTTPANKRIYHSSVPQLTTSL